MELIKSSSSKALFFWNININNNNNNINKNVTNIFE